ncbi:MAG: ATP-dependent Clp protease ATP-binding subunit [Clostridia bacterium]|nr:ATP-dependent Clp protease ATP-binding subunit [Clostridia bacterium]
MLCSRCGKYPAVIFVSKGGVAGSKPEGLCLKCAKELNIGFVQSYMDKMGLTDDDLENISGQLGEAMDALTGEGDGDSFDMGGASTFPFMGLLNNLTGSQGAEEPPAPPKNEEKRQEPDKRRPIFGSRRGRDDKKSDKDRKKLKFLNSFCTNLTEKAREGKTDRIIGRDSEISRCVQILCRRTKNNPCLIGEPGVGKTAIAEGLALRIAAETVPARLLDKEIYLLDMTAMVAGTQFRGQFESRMKGLIDEVRSEGNVILFIDEVHSIVGAGDAEGSMNAANILKPALSRGEVQVIGATTFNEYRKYIEKDAALERRFQPVKVEEPSIEDTVKILMGVKEYYENYHRVRINEPLVRTAVVLSERYITERFLPDKAIDLLDESCTHANLRNPAISELEIKEARLAAMRAEMDELYNPKDANKEPDYERIAELKSEIDVIEHELPAIREKAEDNYVIEDDIAKVVGLWTGIPVSKIIDSDIAKLADLEKHLKAKIIGQDEAVEAVAAAIRRNKIQINPQKRPSSFIFVGPTGVGKTELVKQLSNELFDTPETLIRLDMSEFMEKFSVSRLIGSPPGYVGYDEAGQLTEKVRRKPYSVILFDEIEKAHPDVMNILLQILDEGKTSDAQGRVVNFANTVIIMTSNAGSNRDSAMGFGRSMANMTKEKALKGLHEFLRPEFIGRVDEVIVFNPLTAENYRVIAANQLDDLKPALIAKGITFEYDDDVPGAIAAAAADGERGARDIRIEIRRRIEDPIADIIVNRRNTGVDLIHAFVKDGAVSVESGE